MSLKEKITETILYDCRALGVHMVGINSLRKEDALKKWVASEDVVLVVAELRKELCRAVHRDDENNMCFCPTYLNEEVNKDLELHNVKRKVKKCYYCEKIDDLFDSEKHSKDELRAVTFLKSLGRGKSMIEIGNEEA